MAISKEDRLKQFGLFPGAAVWSALIEYVPTVSRHLARPADGMVSLKLLYRGDNDFLAVAKRYGGDGEIQVCFGSGSDVVQSLSGLEVAMDQNKWRRDKWLNEVGK